MNCDDLAKKRRLLVDFCRLMEGQFTDQTAVVPPSLSPPFKPDPRINGLAPRVRQTLTRMLRGDSEKEIAKNLGISRHTVHIYVKALYRSFEVNSRGELLAKFVDGGYRKTDTR